MSVLAAETKQKRKKIEKKKENETFIKYNLLPSIPHTS